MLFKEATGLLKRMNWTMTIVIGLLITIGVFFIYSSCYVSDEIPVRTLYKKQIMWSIVGLVAYLGFALFDYRRVTRLGWWAYAGSIVLLVLVLIVGTKIYGARRWLMIFGMGIQPSELVKPAMIILLARRLSKPWADLDRLRALLETMAVAAIPFILILKQPDLGTAMMFLPVAFVMMYSAGMPLKYLASILCIGLVAMGIILSALFLPEKLGLPEETQSRVIKMVGLSDYHKDRMTVFFRPDTDPLGAGWNKMQSEIAVGSGGAWGKGLLNGTQNILGFLPRSVAPTDFIFTVIAEEKGFFGSVVVLFLFGVLMLLCFQAALMAPDKTGRLLCMGTVAMLFCHVFVNIGMTVGLMPVTGLPLPLLSYGGSFVVVTLALLGVVQSVFIRCRRV